jgi:DinB superfamily
MAADRSYVGKNDAARERLEKLVASCSNVELAHAMPAGWTVAAVLAHVAFWDNRIQLLLDRWQTTNVPPPALSDDVDWINDAAKPMQLALSPRRAAELTVASAQKRRPYAAAALRGYVESHNPVQGTPESRPGGASQRAPR